MQLQSQLARPGTRSSASPAGVLVIVCAGVVLASLDLFIVNVALPQIARDLHTSSLSELSWVLNGYAIVYASLLVFFGRLADRYRRDRGFLLGAAVFTLASAACAASTSVGMLIGCRLVQAAGAALLTPTSLSLVLASYPPERRSGAVRAWTATGGLAAALGPVIGGLLVAASWRWVFLVNVPIGVAAVVAGWRRLPAVPGHDTERPDPLGVILVTCGIGLLTFGLVKGGDWGWSSLSIVAVLAGGLVLLGLFVAHCLLSRTPLIHPSLFRARSFTGASVVALFFSAAFGAMLLSIVLWEQDVWGWSALRAGLAIAPGPLMVPLLSFVVAGRLIRRYGPALVMSAGCALFGSGICCWAALATVHPDYWPGMLVGMILTGAGVGLTLPTMMATAASSLPPSLFGTGSAVVNMIRQTGIALGVAVLVAVLGTHPGLNEFRAGWWVTAALAFAAIVPAVTLLTSPPSATDLTQPAERMSSSAARWPGSRLAIPVQNACQKSSFDYCVHGVPVNRYAMYAIIRSTF
jgi:EmrB/QacA subfamily drug resistance transporter